MAYAIKATEGPNTFITFHSSSSWVPGYVEATAAAQFGNETCRDLDGIQSGHSVSGCPLLISGGAKCWVSLYNFHGVQNMYAAVPPRPVIDLENHYEYWSSSISTADDGTPDKWNLSFICNGAYHAVFAGAAGVTYREWALYRFANPDRYSSDSSIGETWFQGLLCPGSSQMIHVQTFIKGLPSYFAQIPDQSVLKTPEGESYAWVAAMRDTGGRYLSVYTPMGFPFAVNLTTLVSDRLSVGWRNPRNGTYVAGTDILRSSLAQKGNETFIPPTVGRWKMIGF